MLPPLPTSYSTAGITSFVLQGDRSVMGTALLLFYPRMGKILVIPPLLTPQPNVRQIVRPPPGQCPGRPVLPDLP